MECKMKKLIFIILCIFITKSFTQSVAITSPEEDATLTIPAGHTTRDIEVEWVYTVPQGTQSHHFELKTDVGNFYIQGPAYSKNVEDVPYGSKNWELELHYYDSDWVLHVIEDYVSFEIVLKSLLSDSSLG